MIKEVSSVVAYVNSFVKNKCLQFGFYNDRGDLRRVVVGQDVFRLGLPDWERPINAGPGDDAWMALFLAPLIGESLRSYKVVISFPNAIKSRFSNLPSGSIKIVLPTSAGEQVRTIEIEDSVAIPEAYAHAMSYYQHLKRDCVVISIGFGTIEIGLVDKSAQVFEHRLKSIKAGLHLVAQPFRSELIGLGYDVAGVRAKNQDFYFDSILQKVVDENLGIPTESPLNLIVSGGSLKAKDLAVVAENVLSDYSLSLEKHIADYLETQQFTSPPAFVVTGGGVNYPIVVDKVKAVLVRYGMNDIVIATKKAAKYSAAIGLNIISDKIFKNEDNAIGIDVGNNSILFESLEVIEDAPSIISISPRDQLSIQ